MADKIPAELKAAYKREKAAAAAVAKVQAKRNVAIEALAEANEALAEVQPDWDDARVIVRLLEKEYGIGEYGSSSEAGQKIGG